MQNFDNIPNELNLKINVNLTRCPTLESFAEIVLFYVFTPPRERSPLNFFDLGAIKGLAYVQSYATKKDLLEAVINTFDRLNEQKIFKGTICVSISGGHL